MLNFLKRFFGVNTTAANETKEAEPQYRPPLKSSLQNQNYERKDRHYPDRTARRRDDARYASSGYDASKRRDDGYDPITDISSPLSPLSPISIWNSTAHSTPSNDHCDTSSGSSSDYGSSSSYDSGSSNDGGGGGGSCDVSADPRLEMRPRIALAL